ncbi:MAG: hypothetical protein ACRBFS_07395 [Aureispira sp.]
MVAFLRNSVLVGLFSFLVAIQVSAKVPAFFQIDVEKVFKAQELPDTAYLLLEDGTYMDLGVFYKQLTVFFIPLWNYEIQWCGYVGNDQQLLTLDKQTVEAIVQETGHSIPQAPNLPFWPTIGGKLLFLAILGAATSLSIFFYKKRNKAAAATILTKQIIAPLVERPSNEEETPEL